VLKANRNWVLRDTVNHAVDIAAQAEVPAIRQQFALQVLG
jgi:hypothetical protein